ncbi:MAG: hypothetical protein EXR86_11505 [Gammaproteobacteria bacterium]|nr:hypothetical protein [Gammaproteobacteria bacterium]
MSSYLLVPQDEFPHPPGADLHFNESVYMNAFDHRQRWGGWMRLGNRVNEGYAELAVCLYLPDGRIACQFQRPGITGNTQFSAGGLEVTVHEPLQHLSMHYRGELLIVDDPQLLRDPKALFGGAPRVAAEMHWEQRGISPVHGGLPATATQDTLYGRDFSLGHFNQHTQVRGELRLGTETFALGGCGWRDHSWGPRVWQNIVFDRLYMANFGEKAGLMLLKIANRDGRVRRGGVLMVDGDYEEILDLDIFNEWSEAMDPVSFQLGIRTAKRSARITGRILNCAPLRNRRIDQGVTLHSRIAECFTELYWDGQVGYGMTEYVEVMRDGIPVGYPL